MNKEQLKLGWNYLGQVGVDSGQLMVCDPCYIDSEWEKKDFDTDGGRIIDVKTKKPVKITNWEKEYKKGITFNQARDKGLSVDKGYEEDGDFSYDGCCKGTINKAFSQMNFRMGHAGAGVAFSSGFGDGTYSVEALVKNYGDKKREDLRIAEVKILMIEPEEEMSCDDCGAEMCEYDYEQNSGLCKECKGVA